MSPGRDLFETHLGSTLSVLGGPHADLALRVASIEDYGAADGTRFSVFLTGPADRPLPQGIHTVQPDGHDVLDVFLVPVGQEGDRLLYEAAFNNEGGS